MDTATVTATEDMDTVVDMVTAVVTAMAAVVVVAEETDMETGMDKETATVMATEDMVTAVVTATAVATVALAPTSYPVLIPSVALAPTSYPLICHEVVATTVEVSVTVMDTGTDTVMDTGTDTVVTTEDMVRIPGTMAKEEDVRLDTGRCLGMDTVNKSSYFGNTIYLSIHTSR